MHQEVLCERLTALLAADKASRRDALKSIEGIEVRPEMQEPVVVLDAIYRTMQSAVNQIQNAKSGQRKYLKEAVVALIRLFDRFRGCEGHAVGIVVDNFAELVLNCFPKVVFNDIRTSLFALLQRLLSCSVCTTQMTSSVQEALFHLVIPALTTSVKEGYRITATARFCSAHEMDVVHIVSSLVSNYSSDRWPFMAEDVFPSLVSCFKASSYGSPTTSALLASISCILDQHFWSMTKPICEFVHQIGPDVLSYIEASPSTYTFDACIDFLRILLRVQKETLYSQRFAELNLSIPFTIHQKIFQTCMTIPSRDSTAFVFFDASLWRRFTTMCDVLDSQCHTRPSQDPLIQTEKRRKCDEHEPFEAVLQILDPLLIREEVASMYLYALLVYMPQRCHPLRKIVSMLAHAYRQIILLSENDRAFDRKHSVTMSYLLLSLCRCVTIGARNGIALTDTALFETVQDVQKPPYPSHTANMVYLYRFVMMSHSCYNTPIEQPKTMASIMLGFDASPEAAQLMVFSLAQGVLQGEKLLTDVFQYCLAGFCAPAKQGIRTASAGVKQWATDSKTSSGKKIYLNLLEFLSTSVSSELLHIAMPEVFVEVQSDAKVALHAHNRTPNSKDKACIRRVSKSVICFESYLETSISSRFLALKAFQNANLRGVFNEQLCSSATAVQELLQKAISTTVTLDTLSNAAHHLRSLVQISRFKSIENDIVGKSILYILKGITEITQDAREGSIFDTFEPLESFHNVSDIILQVSKCIDRFHEASEQKPFPMSIMKEFLNAHCRILSVCDLTKVDMNCVVDLYRSIHSCIPLTVREPLESRNHPISRIDISHRCSLAEKEERLSKELIYAIETSSVPEFVGQLSSSSQQPLFDVSICMKFLAIVCGMRNDILSPEIANTVDEFITVCLQYSDSLCQSTRENLVECLKLTSHYQSPLLLLLIFDDVHSIRESTIETLETIHSLNSITRENATNIATHTLAQMEALYSLLDEGKIMSSVRLMKLLLFRREDLSSVFLPCFFLMSQLYDNLQVIEPIFSSVDAFGVPSLSELYEHLVFAWLEHGLEIESFPHHLLNASSDTVCVLEQACARIAPLLPLHKSQMKRISSSYPHDSALGKSIAETFCVVLAMPEKSGLNLLTWNHAHGIDESLWEMQCIIQFLFFYCRDICTAFVIEALKQLFADERIMKALQHFEKSMQRQELALLFVCALHDAAVTRMSPTFGLHWLSTLYCILESDFFIPLFQHAGSLHVFVGTVLLLHSKTKYAALQGRPAQDWLFQMSSRLKAILNGSLIRKYMRSKLVIRISICTQQASSPNPTESFARAIASIRHHWWGDGTSMPNDILSVISFGPSTESKCDSTLLLHIADAFAMRAFLDLPYHEQWILYLCEKTERLLNHTRSIPPQLIKSLLVASHLKENQGVYPRIASVLCCADGAIESDFSHLARNRSPSRIENELLSHVECVKCNLLVSLEALRCITSFDQTSKIDEHPFLSIGDLRRLPSGILKLRPLLPRSIEDSTTSGVQGWIYAWFCKRRRALFPEHPTLDAIEAVVLVQPDFHPFTLRYLVKTIFEGRHGKQQELLAQSFRSLVTHVSNRSTDFRRKKALFAVELVRAVIGFHPAQAQRSRCMIPLLLTVSGEPLKQLSNVLEQENCKIEAAFIMELWTSRKLPRQCNDTCIPLQIEALPENAFRKENHRGRFPVLLHNGIIDSLAFDALDQSICSTWTIDRSEGESPSLFRYTVDELSSLIQLGTLTKDAKLDLGLMARLETQSMLHLIPARSHEQSKQEYTPWNYIQGVFEEPHDITYPPPWFSQSSKESRLGAAFSFFRLHVLTLGPSEMAQQCLSITSSLRSSGMERQCLDLLHLMPYERLSSNQQGALQLEQARTLWSLNLFKDALHLCTSITKTKTKTDLLASAHHCIALWNAQKHMTRPEEIRNSFRKSIQAKADDACVYYDFAIYEAELYRGLYAQTQTNEYAQMRAIQKERCRELDSVKQQLQLILDEPSKKGKKKKIQFWTRCQQRLHLQYELEEEQQEKLRKAILSSLEGAMMNLILALQVGTQQALYAMHELVALWFQSQSTSAAKRIAQLIQEYHTAIPSRHFLCLSSQLIARLGKVSRNAGHGQLQFMETIRVLVRRLIIEHPYHCVYKLVSMTLLGHSNGDTDVPNKDVERSMEAHRVLQQLKGEESCSTIAMLEEQCAAFAALQSISPPAQQHGRQNTPSEVQLSRSKLYQNIQSGMHCPPPTLALPQIGDLDSIPWIESMSEKAQVATTGINCPLILSFVLSDGSRHRTLAKKQDDLRQDAVLQQFFRLATSLAQQDPVAQRHRLGLRTYTVVPLTPTFGLVEFVPETVSLSRLIESTHNQSHDGPRLSHYRQRFREAQETTQLDQCRAAFDAIQSEREPSLHLAMLQRHADPQAWLQHQSRFIKSVATSSIAGYVMGLGDRHLENVLLDQHTSEVVHIDFGIAFDQGRLLPFPEVVPFRLTAEIVAAMGHCGSDGPFRHYCTLFLEILRKNRRMVATLLEIFKYDPLFQWFLPLAHLHKRQLDDEELALHSVSHIATAASVVLAIEHKLSGRMSIGTLCTEGQVNELIRQAQDPDLLVRMYHGWSSWC